MKVKKIVFAAGGTGGHLFPAQALAKKFIKKGVEVLFVSKNLGKNSFFDRDKFSFKEVEAGSLGVKNIFRKFFNLFLIIKGFLQSLRILKDFSPNVVIGFGSFFSFPIVVAAFVLKIPIVLYEQNIEPGKANKWLSPFAKGIGVNFSQTISHFKKHKKVKQVSVLTYTKRPSSLKEDMLSEYFKKEDEVVILVYGGSQGAISINDIFLRSCLSLVRFIPKLRVFHFVGSNVNPERFRSVYKCLNISCVVKSFEKNMNLPLEKADFAICRSGASTIEELIEYEVPAILIPYPFSYQHQSKNAEFFSKVVKGGGICEEKELTLDLFCKKIKDICFLDKQKIFRKNIREYKASIQKEDFKDFVEGCV